MSNKYEATFHPHTAPTLTPELLDRLRNTRGEHLEGMEIVSIPRAQLDALIGALGSAKADALNEAANAFDLTDPIETALSGRAYPSAWLRARAELEAGK